MDCVVHGVTKSRTRLSNFTFDEKGYFCMGTERNLTETKSSISRSLIGLSVSASAYGFHINKKQEETGRIKGLIPAEWKSVDGY